MSAYSTPHLQASMTSEHRLLQILVVEDNADAQKMLCELLTLIGHQPTGTCDAVTALNMLGTAHFDVLFTDVNLPGMSGVHLARKARTICPDIKIVFASGHDASFLSYIDFPSVWLTKPYEFESLLQAVAKLD